MGFDFLRNRRSLLGFAAAQHEEIVFFEANGWRFHKAFPLSIVARRRCQLSFRLGLPAPAEGLVERDHCEQLIALRAS